MPKTIRYACIVYLLLVIHAVSSTHAAETDKSIYVKNKINRALTDGESSYPMSDNAVYLRTAGDRSEIMGSTFWDYQHNGSMGRQVVHSAGDGYILFVWTNWPNPLQITDRKIKYNAYNTSSGEWLHGGGPGGGKEISGGRGGYTTIDITSWGTAIVGFHQGIIPPLYQTKADYDHDPHSGSFTELEPGAPGAPNCQDWVTGDGEENSTFLWPVIAYDEIVTGRKTVDTIIHVVSVESPSGDDPNEIKTIVYYRKLNGQWDGCPSPWNPSDIRGLAIDSVYTISPVVCADPTSDDVAIVWTHPIHYNGDPDDPCGYTQYQNDVYYIESTDAGETWPVDVNDDLITQNITDYTQGGTIPVDQREALAFTDLSALYDSDGTLHIIWNTPLRDLSGGFPCEPLIASRIWHWDDMNRCISLVYDASLPKYQCNPGAWNSSTCKMNISECDGRMYCSFTRFGAHTDETGMYNEDCSDGGYANGDIFLTVSSDGLAWSPAINLTDSESDGCESGNCFSEHWSSMAMYSTDSIHIQYIEDKDAGGWPQQEGAATENPVVYWSSPCYEPDMYCEVGHSPTEIGYPTFISPQDSAGCTGTETVTFDITLTNTGNEPAAYTITSNASWLTPALADGPIQAGCDNIVTITYTIGPIADEGIYNTTLDISVCGEEDSIPVEICVFCDFYLPEYDLLSTVCWSVGVWNVGRVALAETDDSGNMCWSQDSATVLYDAGIIITYADDTTRTWFSIYDGSDSGVGFRTLNPLVTDMTNPEYEYAHSVFCTRDGAVNGEIEYYTPKEQASCFLVQRISIRSDDDAAKTIHVGEAFDWDIDPDSLDLSDKDETRREVYQHGCDDVGCGRGDWYAGAAFCHEIPGAVVLRNQHWVYQNAGYIPAEIGGLLARHTGFEIPHADSCRDLNSIYILNRDVTLGPGQSVVYCGVVACHRPDMSSGERGKTGLQNLLDDGIQWIKDHSEIDCPDCQESGPECDEGDADGSGSVDIDDIVYLIDYIFLGGPAPVEHECCADSDGSMTVDIDDVVYLIAYIFLGGAAPVENACDLWRHK